MMDALRKGARTWVAKVLLIVLVLSFGVWGISGTMFQRGVGDAVLTVGDTEVSPTEFRLAYSRQINQLSQQFGTRLTSEQARALGVENQVLAQLAAGAALDEQARRMNLGLSEDRLAGLIAEDPAFVGPDGRFSRQNFSAILSSIGMSEEEYITNRSQFAVRSQIIEAVAEGLDPPEALVRAMLQHDNEARTIDYVLLSASDVPPIDDPDPATLQGYFEDNREVYRAPEYRSFAYVRLTAEDIADPATISDEAVRADYDARRGRYETAERRTVDQIVFADRAEAEAAADRLAEGASFDSLLQNQGRSLADARLGTFTRENFPGAALADAAFAVGSAGGTTGVVDGPFGPVILRVAEIEPASIEPFESVADDIRRELALVEANEVLLDVYDAFEDARAGGASLEEAARQQRLDAKTVTAIDRTGRTPDGDVLTDLPASAELIEAVFDNEPGTEIAPVDLDNDGYVWAEVVKVEPARDRTLEEVRGQVIEDWRGDAVQAQLDDMAEQMKTRLDGGDTLADVAADTGLAVETKYGLTRGESDPVFGDTAVAAAFGGPQGHSAIAPDASGDARIVLQVADVVGSAISEADAVDDRTRRQLAARAGDDILEQLVARLQRDYGVSVNRRLAEQALSF